MFLKDNFLYKNNRYDVNGFYVYTGMEVDIRYGGHVIVCGKREVLDDLQLKIYTAKIAKNYIKKKIKENEIIN